MARTPRDVFDHHARALAAGDLDEIVADFADDAVMITPAGAFRGRAAIREGYARLFEDLPDAEWDVPTRVFEGDVLLLEWTAVSGAVRAVSGVDTFVFGDDGIRAQTVRYTLVR
ncbi:nuclear transport factor 2 family protein [Dactylosporangium sp. AC04546]|uniref:nuclear transport factor 2 family protein n=1 Tax=Dactylosporangium sp. AC04546 TaxID=2862460 RepID=UPI001EDE4138|nr:nuclear transport factor 2 family protein [Dactylosporangium sp. AC04546]WVK86354.1 nuclear transport factor 2 family protein [Dactylosporangium sp. AC04546]